MSGKFLKKTTTPEDIVPKDSAPEDTSAKETAPEDTASRERGPKKIGKPMRTLLIVLAVLAVLVAAVLTVPKMLIKMYAGMTSKAENVTVPTVSDDDLTNSMLGVPDSPETPTWPEVVATQNVTTIMLVGQDYRKGQEHYLSDTMIMCTINRDTNTLTMTSILRDLYVPLPDYRNHGPGRNRINVCYNLGTVWTGSVKGGMEMLALCVEQNFGIHIDHTVAVDFIAFEKVIDLMGGVDITMTQAEADYLNKDETHKEWKYYPDHTFSAGPQTLNGMDALAYSRIRKIDSDFQRTNRQRTVINSLLQKCKKMGIWDLHKLATEILPLVTTDMTDDEMTNYIWEFIPMLADLNIVSQKIPLDNDQLNGEWSYTGKEVEGIGNVLEPNLIAHKKYLQEILGYADVEE